jgi:hypothetical protein
VSGAGDEPFIAAVKPLVDAMGGEMIPPDEAGPDDVVLAWEGRDAVAVRLPQLADSLDHILAAMERRKGMPLADLDRRANRRSYGYSRRVAPSPYGTGWRPWRAPSASAVSPSTTTSTARRAPDRTAPVRFRATEFSTNC